MDTNDDIENSNAFLLKPLVKALNHETKCLSTINRKKTAFFQFVAHQ